MKNKLLKIELLLLIIPLLFILFIYISSAYSTVVVNPENEEVEASHVLSYNEFAVGYLTLFSFFPYLLHFYLRINRKWNKVIGNIHIITTILLLSALFIFFNTYILSLKIPMDELNDNNFSDWKFPEKEYSKFMIPTAALIISHSLFLIYFIIQISKKRKTYELKF